MSEFIVTPTNIDLLESLFRNPRTGRWVIPILTFNTNYINPYFGESDPLNDDPNYQKSVIDNFYLRLKEKWLYKAPIFRSLLKYFIVEETGDKGTVKLVDDPDQVSNSITNEKYKNHIYKYIEKYFISRRLIKKILKEYVNTTHVKWYDLFHNTNTLKSLFAHKLKKLIISTIYELQERRAKKELTDVKNKQPNRIKNIKLFDSDSSDD